MSLTRGFIPLSMLQVSGDSDQHLLNDGSQISLMDGQPSTITTPLRVVRVTYDSSAGLLQVRYSDGSQKVLLGFLTDSDINNIGQGKTGDRGAVGERGSDALNGRAGSIGPPGCVGVRGDPGPKGSTGRANVKGQAGDMGPQGIRGDAGKKGYRGLTGERGADSTEVGEQGIVGPPGRRGIKGETGDIGIIGPVGDRGCAGIMGPDGWKGDQGETGAAGDRGSAYSGFSGYSGAKGETGVSGKISNIVAGDNMTVVWVSDSAGHKVNVKLIATCGICADHSPPPTQETPTTTPKPITPESTCSTCSPATTRSYTRTYSGTPGLPGFSWLTNNNYLQNQQDSPEYAANCYDLSGIVSPCTLTITTEHATNVRGGNDSSKKIVVYNGLLNGLVNTGATTEIYRSPNWESAGTPHVNTINYNPAQNPSNIITVQVIGNVNIETDSSIIVDCSACERPATTTKVTTPPLQTTTTPLATATTTTPRLTLVYDNLTLMKQDFFTYGYGVPQVIGLLQKVYFYLVAREISTGKTIRIDHYPDIEWFIFDGDTLSEAGVNPNMMSSHFAGGDNSTLTTTLSDFIDDHQITDTAIARIDTTGDLPYLTLSSNIFPTPTYPNLSDDSKNVVNSLIKTWLAQAINLIKSAYGIDPSAAVQSATLRIKLEASSEPYMAQIETMIYNGRAAGFDPILHINMGSFAPADLPNGGHSWMYDDRVVTHEMVHFAQSLTMNYGALPNWFREGAAEFIHGVDERVTSSLTRYTPQNLINRITSGAWGGTSDDYSASYIAIRFLHARIKAAGGSGIRDVFTYLQNNMASYRAAPVPSVWLSEHNNHFANLDDALAAMPTASLFGSTAAFLSYFANQGVSFLNSWITAGLLTNTDTGAIGGQDADGGAVKSAESVIPDAEIGVAAMAANQVSIIWPDGVKTGRINLLARGNNLYSRTLLAYDLYVNSPST